MESPVPGLGVCWVTSSGHLAWLCLSLLLLLLQVCQLKMRVPGSVCGIQCFASVGWYFKSCAPSVPPHSGLPVSPKSLVGLRDSGSRIGTRAGLCSDSVLEAPEKSEQRM